MSIVVRVPIDLDLDDRYWSRSARALKVGLYPVWSAPGPPWSKKATGFSRKREPSQTIEAPSTSKKSSVPRSLAFKYASTYINACVLIRLCT
jgi:hypothetical protein